MSVAKSRSPSARCSDCGDSLSPSGGPPSARDSAQDLPAGAATKLCMLALTALTDIQPFTQMCSIGGAGGVALSSLSLQPLAAGSSAASSLHAAVLRAQPAAAAYSPAQNQAGSN